MIWVLGWGVGGRGTYNEGESLLAAHGHVASDLLVTADTEGTHGVAGLGEHGLLAGELLEHLFIDLGGL